MEKGKKKGTKRKLETIFQELATSEADLKDTSSRFSLTRERLLYGPSLTFQNVEHVLDLDKCVGRATS